MTTIRRNHAIWTMWDETLEGWLLLPFPADMGAGTVAGRLGFKKFEEIRLNEFRLSDPLPRINGNPSPARPVCGD
jgi:hypothetical protein